MNNLAVFYCFTGTLSFILVHQTRAINDVRLEVTEHSLTLQPTSRVRVDQTNGCMNSTSFLQCEGDLSGRNYTWVQENQEKNYVLFSLRRRASISAVNLTYSVDSKSEKPKVSFCAARDDISINSSFTNLKCQEVTIEGTNSATRVKIVPMPFTNITSKIVMEVITQGIKASFTASLVEFFGTYEEIEATETSSPVPITTDTITYDSNQSESISNNTTSGSSPGPTQTSKINAIASLFLGLTLCAHLLLL